MQYTRTVMQYTGERVGHVVDSELLEQPAPAQIHERREEADEERGPRVQVAGARRDGHLRAFTHTGRSEARAQCTDTHILV